MTDEMEVKLLPCPFCGGAAEWHDITEDDEVANVGGSCIICTVCQACGPVQFGEKDTIVEQWNRRALRPAGEASKYHLIFDGSPGPDGPRFIELENDAGHSIGVGEWVDDPRHPGWAQFVLPAYASPIIDAKVAGPVVKGLEWADGNTASIAVGYTVVAEAPGYQIEQSCQRCQGTGEIITDWDRYQEPADGDKGDEAVAECPDCDGDGKSQTTALQVAAPALLAALSRIVKDWDGEPEDMLEAIEAIDLATPTAANATEGDGWKLVDFLDAAKAIVKCDDDARAARGKPDANLNGYGLVDLFDVVDHPFGAGEHKQQPYRSNHLDVALTDLRAMLAAAPASPDTKEQGRG